jgi:hypothetical protein
VCRAWRTRFVIELKQKKKCAKKTWVGDKTTWLSCKKWVTCLSQLFATIKWQTTSFTLGLTLVFCVHHFNTICLTFSIMASLHCFLLNLTHFVRSNSLFKSCLCSWVKTDLKFSLTKFVATLALGSRPRQKGLQGCGPRGGRECKKVWGSEPSHS